MSSADPGDLGAMRQAFEATPRSMIATYARGLFPMAVAAIIVAASLKYLEQSDWKAIAINTLAVVMFLNGVRVVVRTWRRRWQKVAVYDNGFAVWRNNVLTPFHWDKVETINAAVAHGDNDKPAFLGFDVVCRWDDDNRETLRFDPAGDAIDNLQGLWRQLEESWAQHRIPAAITKVNGGEELLFGRQVWGKFVSAVIGVSRMGLHCSSRGQVPGFFDWPQVDAINRKDGRIIITEKDNPSPVVDTWEEDVPGYLTLLAVTEQAQKTYMELLERLRVERIPAAFAKLEQREPLHLGRFTLDSDGLKYEAEFTPWRDIAFARPEVDHLKVLIGLQKDPRRYLYGGLDLADRIVLLAAVEHIQQRVVESEAETRDEQELTSGGQTPP